MSKELTRKGLPSRRRLFKNANLIMFPRELRDAIPDLPTCAGRLLEIESIDGSTTDTIFYGERVNLKIVVSESGKLKGKYIVRMGLQADAARALGETLIKLAKEIG